MSPTFKPAEDFLAAATGAATAEAFLAVEEPEPVVEAAFLGEFGAFLADALAVVTALPFLAGAVVAFFFSLEEITL